MHYTVCQLCAREAFIYVLVSHLQLHETPSTSICVRMCASGPTLVKQLDDLMQGKKDLDETLLFDVTFSLQLDEESTVEAVSSHKSHKIEVSDPSVPLLTLFVSFCF